MLLQLLDHKARGGADENPSHELSTMLLSLCLTLALVRRLTLRS